MDRLTDLFAPSVSRNVKAVSVRMAHFLHVPGQRGVPTNGSNAAGCDKAGFQHFYKNPFRVETNWNKFSIQSDMGYVNSNFKQGPS